MTASYVLPPRPLVQPTRPKRSFRTFKARRNMSSPPNLTEHDGVFARPLAFESQHELHAWLAHSSSVDQQQVDALSFTLIHSEDSDLELEKDAMIQSLQYLPNVRSLAVYKLPQDRYRNVHRQLYDELLRRTAKLWPRLESIAVHTDDHHLGFLRGLQYLRKLQFTGFSASSPMETSAILSHLRHLTDVEIIPALGPPGPRNNMSAAYSVSASSQSSTRNPSLTREVLRSLRGLKSFTLREARATNPSAPAFFTSTFLLGLASATSGVSLSKVTVELADFSPDPEAELRFAQFLAGSHVKHVDIQWGDFNTNRGSVGEVVMEALPRTVVTVRTRGLGRGEALKKLAEKRRTGTLKDLIEITIIVSDADREVRLSKSRSTTANKPSGIEYARYLLHCRCSCHQSYGERSRSVSPLINRFSLTLSWAARWTRDYNP
jgi:hypothetical protein